MLTFRQPAVSACGRDARVPRVLPLTGFLGSPCVSSTVSGIRTPKLPPSPLVGLGDAYRGRFFGKPRCAISRFRHQDAQNPPSPLVGEGGRGKRGKSVWECSRSLISPEKSTLERGVTPGLNGRRGKTGTLRAEPNLGLTRTTNPATMGADSLSASVHQVTHTSQVSTIRQVAHSRSLFSVCTGYAGYMF